MTTPTFDRQTGIFDPAKNTNAACTFIGVGGVGSFAAFAVAKLGIPNITLIDPDVVEPHNGPSQNYGVGDWDTPKVEALSSTISRTTGKEPTVHQVLVTEGGWEQSVLGDDGDTNLPGKPKGLVVSGLDSMKARHDLWHTQLKFNVDVPLYLDVRIDGQLIVIYAVRPWDLDDIEQYEATLLSDDEVLAGVCTERAIIDVGFMIGSLVARAVRRHLTHDGHDAITVVNQKTLTITKGEWLPL